MRKKFIVFLTLFFLVTVVFYSFKRFSSKNTQTVNSLTIAEKEEITDFVKNNITEYCQIAKLLHPQISAEKTIIHTPFKIFSLSLQELKSAQSNLEILNNLKPTSTRYVPISWGGSEGIIVLLDKSPQKLSFSGINLDKVFPRTRESLGKVGLDWEGQFYFTMIAFPDSYYQGQVIFTGKEDGLVAIPVSVLNEEIELRPIPALELADLLKE